MKLTEDQLAEWEALVPKLYDDADDHMDVAQSVDMRPEHTANYRHAKNALEAASAIHSLIAELREAQRHIAHQRTELGTNKSYIQTLQANLDVAEAKLAEAEKDAERWKERAEFEYSKNAYPDNPGLAVGALDAHMRVGWTWAGKQKAIDAAIAAKEKS